MIISLENSNETSNSLFECKSIAPNKIRNQECLTLPKEGKCNKKDINEEKRAKNPIKSFCIDLILTNSSHVPKFMCDRGRTIK